MPLLTKRSRRAFSLLEILIATAIFTMILVAAVGIFTSTTASTSTSGQLRLNIQTGRFIFESLAREVRLSRGLVMADQDATAKNRFIIPPFHIIKEGTRVVGIAIFQVEKTSFTSAGDPEYSVTCRVYSTYDTDRLAVWTYRSSRPMTADNIRQNIPLEQCRPVEPLYGPVDTPVDVSGFGPAEYWQNVVGPSDLLPQRTKLGQFKIVNWHDYSSADNPLLLGSPDDLKVQPFIQLQLSVLTINKLTVGQTGKEARTTLRSNIVPRDFSSKYEVAQVGVRGVGQ